MQECIIPFADPIVIIAAAVGFLIFVNKAHAWTEIQYDKRKKLRRGR